METPTLVEAAFKLSVDEFHRLKIQLRTVHLFSFKI